MVAVMENIQRKLLCMHINYLYYKFHIVAQVDSKFGFDKTPLIGQNPEFFTQNLVKSESGLQN